MTTKATKATKRPTTAEVVALSAKKARSVSDRPRLSPSTEAKFDDVEKRTAGYYAEVELAAHRLQKLADEIDGEDAMMSAVPEEVDESDSLVAALDDVRQKAQKATDGELDKKAK